MKYFPLFVAMMGVSFSALAQGPSQISLDDLRKKYANDISRFVAIDGAEIHYRDEGQGPVVVLLHASYFNLLAWDGLTEALVDDHRVIRFDFPNVGLSGPETKEPPGGRFNLIERNVEVFSGLVEELGLDQFDLVATSSGGSVGFRYASRFPENVTRLVLINSAGMPRTARTDPNRARPELAQWDDMPVKPASIGSLRSTGISRRTRMRLPGLLILPTTSTAARKPHRFQSTFSRRATPRPSSRE